MDDETLHATFSILAHKSTKITQIYTVEKIYVIYSVIKMDLKNISSKDVKWHRTGCSARIL
jgi:hypothetical protein